VHGESFLTFGSRVSHAVGTRWIASLMRSAGHSHAALLLIGAALLAVLAVVALNTLSQPSLPPSVNAIEIGEPREEMSSRTNENPGQKPDPGQNTDPGRGSAPGSDADPDRDADSSAPTRPEPTDDGSGEGSIPPVVPRSSPPRSGNPSVPAPAPAPSPPADAENGDDAGED
jgi:hypothetical protein